MILLIPFIGAALVAAPCSCFALARCGAKPGNLQSIPLDTLTKSGDAVTRFPAAGAARRRDLSKFGDTETKSVGCAATWLKVAAKPRNCSATSENYLARWSEREARWINIFIILLDVATASLDSMTT
jgi:hypothetical protein